MWIDSDSSSKNNKNNIIQSKEQHSGYPAGTCLSNLASRAPLRGFFSMWDPPDEEDVEDQTDVDPNIFTDEWIEKMMFM